MRLGMLMMTGSILGWMRNDEVLGRGRERVRNGNVVAHHAGGRGVWRMSKVVLQLMRWMMGGETKGKVLEGQGWFGRVHARMVGGAG